MTKEFSSWLNTQRPKTRAIVKARLDMISLGHFGKCRYFDGLIELKWINGTRVYTFLWQRSVVVALYGGNKNGQSRDIEKAKGIKVKVIEGTQTLLK